MPSERFMRLPEEKQNVIWEAAMEEFIRVPFEKASINKVIQKAGISRGSFYTYFEDKRELLQFVLERTKKQWLKFSLNYLKEHQGDFGGMIEALQNSGMDFCGENDLIRFHQNMVMYPELSVLEPPQDTELGDMKRRFYECADCSEFRGTSFEYFALVMEQAMASCVMTVACFYRDPERKEELKQEFKKKLQIIRYGACRTWREE